MNKTIKNTGIQTIEISVDCNDKLSGLGCE